MLASKGVEIPAEEEAILVAEVSFERKEMKAGETSVEALDLKVAGLSG